MYCDYLYSGFISYAQCFELRRLTYLLLGKTQQQQQLPLIHPHILVFMQRFVLILLLACGLALPALQAQAAASGDLGRIPIYELPSLDNDALLAEELAARQPGRAPRFAYSHEVDIRPSTHGQWINLPNNKKSWRLRLQSPGAKSLNLGFLEYWMPEGGQLFLYPGGQKGPQIFGPFTPADNEVHNQLWTQVIDGDDLVLEVIVPSSEQANLRLWLKYVNHDFLGFGAQSAASGSCNLDVACSAADGWGIVDQYRDIIRSVAVISTGGGTFCTGFLVNNARQDCTPYFMTANHCGINAGNAPSLVTYWNYENSFCRQPNTPASGAVGDGQLNDFNTGATWRASYPASDVTIVELDDEVSPTSNAFFAGWSREFELPTDTIIAIHHPRTDEKRITFTFQEVYRANGLGGPPNPNGTHLEIPDWDIGTTEGGSSGSPVFDKFHRVRGQLHGGGAACGNDLYDSYGYFAVSWEGGGTPTTRLRDWLDPDNTGVLFIDGKELLSCQISVSASPPIIRTCAPAPTTFNLLVGGGFENNVNLSIANLPANLAAAFSANGVAPNSPVSLTITPEPGASGSFTFQVLANDGNLSSTTDLTLHLIDGVPASPAAMSPTDGAQDYPLVAQLSWTDQNALSYEYQLAQDPAFALLLASGTTEATSYNHGALLDGQTTYYWRVRATNECGNSEWSAAFTFTTLNQVCGAAVESDDIPIEIVDSGTPTVFSALESEVITPISFMTVALTIEHTWVGDLRLTLTSPEGTEVTLVDRIGAEGGGFGCNGDNYDLIFSDGATNTYQDLAATCGDLPAASGTYQPLEALATFNGENPEGTWILTVYDEAGGDGGQLTNWNITFCGANESSDFSLSIAGDAIEVCPTQSGGISLQLGADFGNEPGVTASFNGNPLINFTGVFNPSNRVLSLGFTNFAMLPPGQQTISVTVTSPNGSRTIDVPITILPLPQLAQQLMPANGSTLSDATLTFSWNEAPNATEYALQVSSNETFATIDFSTSLSTTSFTTSTLGLSGQLYWRVVASNSCGDATSAGFGFVYSPSSLQEFSGGRSLLLYPNPSHGQLSVNMQGSWQGEVQLSLFSLQGQVLATWIVAGGGQQQIDAPKLPAGTYLMRIRSGQEQKVERLVILP